MWTLRHEIRSEDTMIIYWRRSYSEFSADRSSFRIFSEGTGTIFSIKGDRNAISMCKYVIRLLFTTKIEIRPCTLQFVNLILPINNASRIVFVLSPAKRPSEPVSKGGTLNTFGNFVDRLFLQAQKNLNVN